MNVVIRFTARERRRLIALRIRYERGLVCEYDEWAPDGPWHCWLPLPPWAGAPNTHVTAWARPPR